VFQGKPKQGVAAVQVQLLADVRTVVVGWSSAINTLILVLILRLLRLRHLRRGQVFG
jgi:hypothetical protein